MGVNLVSDWLDEQKMDEKIEEKINEALVQKAFTQIGKNKTVIMIAHRLSTVKDADIIYVLQNGRVSESGTHNELVAKEETQDNYRHMWNEYQKSIAWKVV